MYDAYTLYIYICMYVRNIHLCPYNSFSFVQCQFNNIVFAVFLLCCKKYNIHQYYFSITTFQQVLPGKSYVGQGENAFCSGCSDFDLNYDTTHNSSGKLFIYIYTYIYCVCVIFFIFFQSIYMSVAWNRQ